MEKTNNEIKEFSTTKLAKEMNMSTNDLFQKLLEFGLIVRNNSNWELTDIGKSKGGVYKNSDKFGRFITWPESIKIELLKNSFL